MRRAVRHRAGACATQPCAGSLGPKVRRGQVGISAHPPSEKKDVLNNSWNGADKNGREGKVPPGKTDAREKGRNMADNDRSHSGLTGADLAFLVSTAAPEICNQERMKQILEEDEDFRNAFLDDDRTIRSVVSDREVFLKISPRLYFEILLRKVRKELETASHTIEHGGLHKVAVFDAGKVVDFLSQKAVLVYLADMLSSFTKVESYSIPYRVRERVWRKIRYHDADVDCLIRNMEFAGEELRFPFYKRIADICLFLLGVFPEYVRSASRYPLSGEQRPRFVGWTRWSMEEYEEEGRKYYKLASLHPMARDQELSEVFGLLHDSFHVARKPLLLIAENYMHCERPPLADSQADG